MKTLLAVLVLSISAFAADAPATSQVRLTNTLRWGYRKMPYYIDGTKFNVKRNQYIVVNLTPGKHTISVWTPKNHPEDFTIEDNTVSTFSIEEKAMGWGGLAPHILPSADAEFQISNLKEQVK